MWIGPTAETAPTVRTTMWIGPIVRTARIGAIAPSERSVVSVRTDPNAASARREASVRSDRSGPTVLGEIEEGAGRRGGRVPQPPPAVLREGSPAG